MNLAEQLVALTTDKRKTILVAGDIMLDHWVHGRLEECQEGCPKFVEEHVVRTIGGAGNASNSLCKWKVDTTLVGQSTAHRVNKTRLITAEPTCELRTAYRIDDERCLAGFDPANYKWAHDEALEMVRFVGAVLLSDYDKGFLTPKFIREVVALCHDYRVPCVVDAKREPALYRGAVLKCNSDYHTKYRECVEFNNLVVTHGAGNPVVWERHLPSGLGYDLSEVKCVNHVGAGDCFAAHLALALAYGFSLKDAAAVAHSAGRVYVQFVHSRPPKPEEIVEDMSYAVKG